MDARKQQMPWEIREQNDTDATVLFVLALRGVVKRAA